VFGYIDINLNDTSPNMFMSDRGMGRVGEVPRRPCEAKFLMDLVLL
jgi:hypothetical protein